MKGRDQAPRSPQEFQNPGTGGTADPRGGAASSAPSHGNRGESSGIGSTGIGSRGRFPDPAFPEAPPEPRPLSFSRFPGTGPTGSTAPPGNSAGKLPEPPGSHPRDSNPAPCPLSPLTLSSPRVDSLSSKGSPGAWIVTDLSPRVPSRLLERCRSRRSLGKGRGTKKNGKRDGNTHRDGVTHGAGPGHPRIPHLCLRELREWPDL